MCFEYRRSRNGRQILIEERENALSGRSELVVVAIEAHVSEAEVQEICADAMAAWLHPVDPPDDWFDERHNSLSGCFRGLVAAGEVGSV